MKIESLFNLIADSRDLLDLFEGVESPEQLISALERLKRRDNAEELLDCIAGLRMTITRTLNDTLEMSASVDDLDDEDSDDSELMAELEKIDDETKSPEDKISSDSPEQEQKK